MAYFISCLPTIPGLHSIQDDPRSKSRLVRCACAQGAYVRSSPAARPWWMKRSVTSTSRGVRTGSFSRWLCWNPSQNLELPGVLTRELRHVTKLQFVICYCGVHIMQAIFQTMRINSSYPAGRLRPKMSFDQGETRFP